MYWPQERIMISAAPPDAKFLDAGQESLSHCQSFPFSSAFCLPIVAAAWIDRRDYQHSENENCLPDQYPGHDRSLSADEKVHTPCQGASNQAQRVIVWGTKG